MRTIEQAQQFGGWALNAAVQGRDGAAFVWAFAACHFGRKALEAGAILTAEGWKEAPRPEIGVGDDFVADPRASWIMGGDPVVEGPA